MNPQFFAVIVLILVVSLTAEPLRFDNYKVYTIKVQDDVQLEALRSLSTGPHQYEFIDEPNGEKVDLIVPPHLQDNFELLISEKRMNVELAIPNLQNLIDRESPKKAVAASVEDFSWDQYYDIELIHEWLYYMAEQYEEVTIINIGKSFEGRDILGVNINRNPAGNPGIFMEFNIHAREWITSATATYIINQLLTATDDDPEMKELADNYNWYFIPVVNVDGYEYSREHYRLWRKTRSRQGYICTGVDPNRNFNVFWEQGGIGSADNMCEIMYAGPEAFSEVETRALSEYILSIRENLNLYIACHSAAQMLLMPWGHSPEQVPQYTNFVIIKYLE